MNVGYVFHAKRITLIHNYRAQTIDYGRQHRRDYAPLSYSARARAPLRKQTSLIRKTLDALRAAAKEKRKEGKLTKKTPSRNQL